MPFQLSELDRLVVYRGILQDPIMQTLRSQVSDAEKVAALIQKAEELSLEGNVVSELLVHLIAEDENPFSIMAEKSGGHLGSSLMRAVLHDLGILKQFFHGHVDVKLAEDLLSDYHPTRCKIRPYLTQLHNVLLDADSAESAAMALTEHYVRHGYGDMARY